MENYNRKRSKQISLRVTPEVYEKFNTYCRKEDIKKQDLLEKHLKGLFNIVDAYFEG